MKNKKRLLLIKKILKIALFSILGAVALIVAITTFEGNFTFSDEQIEKRIESGKAFKKFEHDSYKFESAEPLWPDHYFLKFYSAEKTQKSSVFFTVAKVDYLNRVGQIARFPHVASDVKLVGRHNDESFLILVNNSNKFLISKRLDGYYYEPYPPTSPLKVNKSSFDYSQYEQPQDDSGTSEVIHYTSSDFNSTYYHLINGGSDGRFLTKAPDGNFIRFFAKDMEDSTMVDMDTLVKITESEYDQAEDTSLNLQIFLEEENEKVVIEGDCFYITLDNGSQKPFCDPAPGVFGARHDYVGYVPLLNQHLITFSIEEGGHLLVSGVDGEIFRILNSNIRILPKNDSIFIFSSRPDYGESYEMGGISFQEYSSDVVKKQGQYYGGISWGVNGFKVSEDGNLYFEIEVPFGYPTEEHPYKGDPKSFYFKQPLDI